MPASPVAMAAQQFAARFGVLVTGGAKTLPASTTAHLFSVTGGRILLVSMTGVVGTVVQAQACTISIGNTPTGGAASVASIAAASASVSGLAVGATFGVPPFSSSAVSSTATGTITSGAGSAALANGVPASGFSLGFSAAPSSAGTAILSNVTGGSITWNIPSAQTSPYNVNFPAPITTTSGAVAATLTIAGLGTGAGNVTLFGLAAATPAAPAAAALVFSTVNGVLPAADAGIALDTTGSCLCMVPAGNIDWTTSATNTGAVAWSVSYVPFDAGATVTAL